MVHIEQFKDYYLTRRIGIGGMAEIFRAWKIGEEGFEKQVVIKRLLPHLASNDDFRTMFLDEARLASRLNHSNIVHVYDLGSHPDQRSGASNYFIAMEYVFGKNLAEIRNKSQEKKLSLSLEYLLRIIAGAAAALHHAHERKGEFNQPLNIVHRDVSPQNILISYDGDVKLVDFGIAKALTKSQHTQTGVLKGKLAYMSPEQARGDAIDHRADIYSLGVVFWEFLTGKRLFGGESEASMLRKVLDPRVEPPSSISSLVSSELEALCMKCLAPNPEDRYPNAMALNIALETHLRELTMFPGSYSVRDLMRTLFGPEIENETQQMQEEVKAVRHYVSTGEQPGQGSGHDSDLSATVIVPSKASMQREPSKAKEAVSFPQSVPGGWKTLAGLGGGLLLLVLVLVLVSGRQSKDVEIVPRASISTSEVLGGELEIEDHRLGEVVSMLEQGDVDEAWRMVTEAEDGVPWNNPRWRDVRASIMIKQAEFALSNDDPEQALSNLGEVLVHIPDSAEAFLHVGRALTRLERNDEALEAYNKAVEIDPSLVLAHYNRGVLLLKQGDHRQAEDAFLTTLGLTPPFVADVFVNLAGTRARAGDMEQAIAHLRRAVAADPDHEIARLNLERLTQ
ncbi:protein kinase domain-containing protein [Desulfonatronum thiodismutans]|uniref:protein kinase domain-containing protein n=1 Tax=Desulfonatronum thiodismutans TaxID=159290 RepID=UPI00068967EC|nr:protein kinase [Desulfonatronum thiodismutans]